MGCAGVASGGARLARVAGSAAGAAVGAAVAVGVVLGLGAGPVLAFDGPRLENPDALTLARLVAAVDGRAPWDVLYAVRDAVAYDPDRAEETVGAAVRLAPWMRDAVIAAALEVHPRPEDAAPALRVAAALALDLAPGQADWTLATLDARLPPRGFAGRIAAWIGEVESRVLFEAHVDAATLPESAEARPRVALPDAPILRQDPTLESRFRVPSGS